MKTIDNKERHNCETLTQIMLYTMKADGYSCKNEFYIFRSLIHFCKNRYEGYYSPDAGAVFLEEKCKFIQSKGHQVAYRNAIARLDKAFIGEFHWKPEPDLKPYPNSCFDEIVKEYEDYLKQTNKTMNDIRRHVRLAAEFLAVAEQQGVVQIEDITPTIVYTAFEQTGAKECFRKIKPFFRYAFMHELISKDLSEFVPSISRHKPIPAVYSPAEINTALETIDRTNSRFPNAGNLFHAGLAQGMLHKRLLGGDGV